MAKYWLLQIRLIIFLLHYSSAYLPNITTDQLSLLSLKNRLTSDPYGLLEDWTISSPVCNWTGVTCGRRHRRVTGLNISGMSLTGEIPPHLGNLSFLISLDLGSNNFTGIIPRELAHLRRLRILRLSYNSFNVFLNSFSNESTLERLYISNNSLQGNIRESIGNLRNLKVLDLGYNQLSGIIPASLANISGLETLDLSGNSIQGSIPENIGNLDKLNTLRMQENQFTSSIPNSIFNISTLEALAFSHNPFLSGALPDDMFLRLPILKELYLSVNQIHGRIPSSLAACPLLQILVLAGNNFNGVIPLEIGYLQSLEILYLGGNMLSGIIPSSLGNMSSLEEMDLSVNSLQGNIPEAFGNLGKLSLLYLNQNQLTGSIPDSILNISTLESLDLGENMMSGVIPQRFSELSALRLLSFNINNFSGFVPAGVFNISTLRAFSVTENNLFGKLPSNLCNSLSNIQQLYLGGNKFNGDIPNSVSNCSQLDLLDLARNEFMGAIPNSIGELRFLRILNLGRNNLTGQSTSSDLSLITSLTNCRYLEWLSLYGNPMNGILPASVGNLSSSLQFFSISNCRISGHIPNEIGNLSGLETLALDVNNLNGVIPATLDGLRNLQRLFLGSNQLQGSIPKSLCSLKNLGLLTLGNQLAGPIPECLGNMSALRHIYLNSNNLSSSIPESIWSLQDLLELDISSNSISGSLSPQIGNLKVSIYINLSNNDISGDLPNTFQGLQSMINFSLAHNKFQGPIPNSISGMLGLETLDLSHNNLSGIIPKSLEELKHLGYFNVSFNQLSGEIPSGGPFGNLTSQSFQSNSALCGLQRYQVPPCKESKSKSKLKKEFHLAIIIVPVVAFVVACILTMAIIRCCRKNAPQVLSGVSLRTGISRISYFEVLRSTDRFSDINFLGKGSFGSVYRGVFGDGKILAIKVFNLQLEGALKTFDAECEILRNIRHRNLVKVISSCSNQDFKALVLEYMPNGSLEKWLHTKEVVLSLMQRLSIMIDVATALEYLHHGYSTPVVHCDLKPSNVLLDEDMTAHVSDFGIAQLLGEEESRTHTRTLATIGYMAPEYGLDGRISTRCDVYSYGIMVLETFTGRQPGHEMFCENMNLKNWVKDALPDGLIDIIDGNMRSEEEHFVKKMSCVSSVLELALCCLAESPTERMNMKDVLAALKKIKNQFMASNSGI